jgi:ribosomal protein S18 acetylase RimI-like enzyme
MTAQPRIAYAMEPDLDVAEFRHVLVESGMDRVRPINDEARLRAMLAKADLIVTARLDQPGSPLVGLARGVTDFNWACYLAEVAVCKSAQRLGVGKGLLDEARRQLGPRVSVFLASVPESAAFYERIGMTRLDHGFYFRRAE